MGRLLSKKYKRLQNIICNELFLSGELGDLKFRSVRDSGKAVSQPMSGIPAFSLGENLFSFMALKFSQNEIEHR